MLTKEQVRARYNAVYIGCKSQGDVRQPQLILRPLSAITDEDAYQVSKIFGHKHPDIDWGRSLVECFQKWKTIYGPEKNDTTLSDGANITDYLRSRGYYTGNFMGFDPIAEGWCIVDEKNGTVCH